MGKRSAARGFGLLEALVATMLTTLIIGALAAMLGSLQISHADLSDRIGAQQSARIALHRVQADLAMAGVGIVPIAPVVPALVPVGTDGLEIRHNGSGVRSRVRDNTGSTTKVPLGSVEGFETGDIVLIYDGSGDFEILEVGRVLTASRELLLKDAMGRVYTADEATVVVKLDRIIYRLDNSTDPPTLTRQENSNAPQPVATDIDQFRLVYFDDSSPPVTFAPATAAQQTRIRAVNVRLAIRTADERIQIGDRPVLSFAGRTSPRALAWRGS
jgi:hypothetical protein